MLSFIKYSGDADKLGNLLNSDEGFRRLGRKEVDVLNNCVSAKLTMSENEEVLDVCEAIRVMNERAVVAEKIAAAKRMLRAGKLSYKEIAEFSDLTVAEVEKLAAKESA